ncbi:MAG: murein biosynthesis integral membrane protein MurJ [Bordetella sp.]|nr:MAG: murein biosynthesis integral membrane protein MurJ [Bordetella sp.]
MSLFHSALIISSLTLFSRITGLMRDITIAFAFGAGPLTDAFWIAFRIPNLLRRLFAEGAFSQAFIPIIGEIQQNTSKKKIRLKLSYIAFFLTVIVSVVTIIGIVNAFYIIKYAASGISKNYETAKQFEITVCMTRIMFPYIIFISLTAFCSGILNVWKKFFIPAITPMFLNISIILFYFLFRNFLKEPIYSLAIGVLIGGILQCIIQWLALYRINLTPCLFSSFYKSYQSKIVQKILKKMIPSLLGVSAAQLSLFINTNIATRLEPGSITWLSFSDRIMELPVSLLGVTFSTLLITNLSKASIKNNRDAYSGLIDWGLRLTLLFGIPISIGMIVFSEALVTIFFHYGKFTVIDVINTKKAVSAYSIGLIGLLAVKILATGFYAQHNIKTPLKISIYSLIITQLMNIFFVPWLGHPGLALSIGLGACFNALFLFIILIKNGILILKSGWVRFILQLTIASIALYYMIFYLNENTNWILLQSSYLKRFMVFLLFSIFGIFTYFSILFLLVFV